MVCEEVLFIIVRFTEACLDMRFESERALSIPSERIGAECDVAADEEVIDLIAEEIVFSIDIPFELLLVLASGPGINIHRVHGYIRFATEVVLGAERVVVGKFISDSHIDF